MSAAAAGECSYLQRSGLGGLITALVAALRCYQPPESLECFLASQLREGLRIGAEGPATGALRTQCNQTDVRGMLCKGSADGLALRNKIIRRL